MTESYLPVLFALILAMVFPLGIAIVSAYLGPLVHGRAKLEAYESGVPAVGSVREGVPVKFYRVAILFLLFDVETAFLIPWAVMFRRNLLQWGLQFLILELGLFLVVVVAGYVYAWRRGALEWD